MSKRCGSGIRRLITGILTIVLAVSYAWTGMAAPLGASYNAAQTEITFRVFSGRATHVEVCVYAKNTGEAEKWQAVMDADPTTKVWSKTVTTAELNTAGVTGTVYYGYRAWGPNWTFNTAWTKGTGVGFISDVDGDGNRFNPNKLLVDPYALELSHDPRTPGQNSDDAYLSGPHRNDDSGSVAPKGIVLKTSTPDIGTKPVRPFKDDIVYEVHLRGLTMADTTLPANVRGTYAGASGKAPYLKSIGVTAVEFLPVQECQNDQNDVVSSTDGDNYWGYDPIAYFAPDRRYASDKTPGGPTREFQAMVKAFHDQGLKVFIDVVYNHTGEGGAGGDGTVARIESMRGLDNPAYYELWTDHHFYVNNNGVGPNLNTANTIVRNLAVDSITYWKDVLGVDGFRFDLAPVLGNTCSEGCFNFNKFDADNILNRLVKELPVRPAVGGNGADLLAEPWGIGDGTYQVGEFPSWWAEWNDKFRDSFRKAQNQLGVSNVPPAELARRFSGSANLFQDDGRKPWHSLNFLVAHDGFTLRDLYSYNGKKNNQSWPFGPSDGGSDNNISWDQGGDTGLQRQAARTGFSILMLSAGVPMITGGDEMYRTQFGNNNVYNLDSPKNYLDWTSPALVPHFVAFTSRMMAFRQAHPALRPAEFFTGEDGNHNGLKDITWLQNDGHEADGAYLDNTDNHFLAYRIDGTEAHDPADSLYVAYNGWSGDITATLPPNLPGKQWFRVADTGAWMEMDDNCKAAGSEDALTGPTYGVHARSLVLLMEK